MNGHPRDSSLSFGHDPVKTVAMAILFDIGRFCTFKPLMDSFQFWWKDS